MRPLLFSLLCFFSQVCFGQINLSLSNVSTKQALQELAAQAHVKFFYKPEHIDTTFVSTELHNATLENALNKILPPLGFSYVQYDDYNIVLIKDQSIKTRMSGIRSRELISATVGTNEANPNKNNITLSGYVKDAKSGEPVIGALVHLTAINQGAATNLFGFYSVEVPYGRHRLKVTYVGYEDEIIDLNALSSGSLDIEIFESTTELEEVIITSEAEDINVQGTQTGLSKLSIQTIKNLPAFLGEVDLVKSMLLLPGVSTVGEGASGFNVRGGDVSQNLILLDDALIFNSSHLFGFFSVFHPDLVKEVTLYKGGIPSYYGGRLAAVMDVKLKEGNNKKVISKGSLGLISGKLAVEGPVNQGKGSFIIGARASFLNWMLKKTKNVSLATSRGGYNDITGKMTYSLGDKDKLYLTFYNSSDHFQLTSDNTFGVINTAQTFRWTHAFGSKLFASLTGVNGSTRTDISNDIPPDAFTMSSG
ncbi:MAG: TonB-dependent receptor, partial [Cyclobacteriaceae bacterium]|nr:TonB-dependent receptor [Cyclobacteriaceae bacterium]